MAMIAPFKDQKYNEKNFIVISNQKTLNFSKNDFSSKKKKILISIFKNNKKKK